MFDFRRIPLFCVEKRLSKHKMTIFSKNLGEAMAPLASPGYAYVRTPGKIRSPAYNHDLKMIQRFDDFTCSQRTSWQT